MIPDFVRIAGACSLAPRVEHVLERRAAPQEVGDQDLHAALGVDLAEDADHLVERPGPTVGLVVAVHARDDGVPEPEEPDRLGHAARLIEIDRRGAPGRDPAEAAGSRADVAQHEERRRAAAPAVVDVRALRLLADAVEAALAHEPLEIVVLVREAPAHLDPGRELAAGRRAGHLEFTSLESVRHRA